MLRLTSEPTFDTVFYCPVCEQRYRYDYETALEDGDIPGGRSDTSFAEWRSEARAHADEQHKDDQCSAA